MKLEKPLRVNDRCDVSWRGGQECLPAVIVDRRPSRSKRLNKRRREVAADIETLPMEDVEYYVHYINHDRRLDEWVGLEKLKLDTLQRHENCPDDTAPIPNEQSVSRINKIDRSTRRRSSPGELVIEKSVKIEDLNNSNHNDSATLSLSGGNWHGGGSHGSHSNDPVVAAYEREHEETTKVKNVEKIVMGSFEVEAWYYSPFPDDYNDVETLYVCDFCLTYMRKAKTYKKHVAECTCRTPPGLEIYREHDLAVYEVDGKDHKAYCQKLCLLAKLFLDHKTLYYDVNPFYFYVVTKVDHDGSHIVGYFSKEKVRVAY